MEKHGTILIVDDMELNRLKLRSVLKENYNIIEASNGNDALLLYDSHASEIVVILLDITMPLMDGFEIATKLKEKKNWNGASIILTTSDSSEKNVVRGYQAGANDILKIPFTPEIVIKKIESHASHYKMAVRI